jgi:catechol 2,3-dioxygenase-like lactoylglutathione lyase family enzyme
MDTSLGAPPKSGWASFVPELLVQDIEPSLAFWCDVLGFAVAYRRPEERFAYLERPEGSQVMLSQRSGKWETAALERPYGRGVMFQLTIASIAPVQAAISRTGWPIYAGPREVWRVCGDRESGQREIFVLDPDGYLIMVAEPIGERPSKPN